MKTKEEIKKAMKQLEQEYLATAKTEFKEQCAALFDENPRLKSFGWNQYTPYFNDGDECTFHCNKEEPKINGCDYYGDENDEETKGENLYALAQKTTGYGPNEAPNEKYDPSAAKTVKAVKDFLESFNDDYFKHAFGDHVELKVTRRGVSVDEYSHD